MGRFWVGDTKVRKALLNLWENIQNKQLKKIWMFVLQTLLGLGDVFFGPTGS